MSVLSAELVQELSGNGGQGATDDLCLSAKRKRSKYKEENDNENIDSAPLSKSARKKQEQLQLKRDKELKRSEYFKLISENSISEQQRKLLICAKDIGQEKSRKKKLKRSMGKQHAGVPLNSEEKKLLFVEKSQRCDDQNIVLFNNNINCLQDINNSHEEATLDVDSSSKRAAQTPSLLQQFEDIKAKGTKKSPSSSGVEIMKRDVRNNSDVNSQETRGRYVPTKTVIPISDHGRVTSSLQSVGDGSKTAGKSTRHLGLTRDPVVQESRLSLPICSMEQEIIEAITANDVIILCGETGSGKSTQVPQFLYENGFSSSGLIGITQPRRVAVTSTASRVAYEMGHPLERSAKDFKGIVGYQIRHDSSTLNKGMHIKFMTDGILLKELSSDILLKKYNVVIIDEAHERNVNTDVLLGMLSRAIPLRKRQHEKEVMEWMKISPNERENYEEPIKPLRLIIMSATLRVDDFLSHRLFSVLPPVVKVESRQYSVKTHFSKRTNVDNYLEEAFQKVCQIHRKLPAGGILLFLTGKRDIVHMCQRLSVELNKENSDVHLIESEDLHVEEIDGLLGSDEREAMADRLVQNACENKFEEDERLITVDKHDVTKSDNAVMTNGLDDSDDNADRNMRQNFLEEALGGGNIDDEDLAGYNNEKSSSYLNCDNSNKRKSSTSDTKNSQAVPSLFAGATVLPLYALLAAERQKKVFQEPPEGHRLIVVATNVAETSITIPGVRYVVDCGRQKERIIDAQSGISKYEVTWISKASANQRTGRAGRTGPGHCYRLYSSSFFSQHMADFQEPEITTFPMEDLVLQLRSIGIQDVNKFPFPTSPPLHSLVRAEAVLTNLGAFRFNQSATVAAGVSALGSIDKILSHKGNVTDMTGAVLTNLGKTMAKFPVNARFAKMLIIANKAGNIPFSLCIAVVVCLTERTIFSPRFTEHESPDCNDIDDDADDEPDTECVTTGDLMMHPTSDILARVRAFGAFFYFMNSRGNVVGKEMEEKSILKFCSERGLHHSSLNRCLQLYKQLCQICHDYLSKPCENDTREFMSLPLPSHKEETALRQIMLTGFGDSVARRVPAGSSIFGAACSKRKKLTGYLSCDPAITVPIYIHPTSTFYQKDPMAPLPEYVIYTELLMSEDGETTYMSGITQVAPDWIPELMNDCPLLRWLPPMLFPLPFYDKKSDSIKCFASATFGIHKWELPVCEYDMHRVCRLHEQSTWKENKNFKNTEDIFRWFGRFFLEGKTLSCQSELKILLRKPNFLKLPTVLTDEKTNTLGIMLVKSLAKYRVFSMLSLRNQLKKDRKYLMKELMLFLKEAVRRKFVVAWEKEMLN